jgi:photosystem II stability/assembly factor-like uncharacterized protein/tetratricopeptide (TPR) repeat protein
MRLPIHSIFTGFILPVLLFWPGLSNGQSLSVIESGTNDDLNAIHFSDEFHGWAVGDSGVILKTTDAGTSWERVVTRFTDTLNTVMFFDHLTGWAGGSNELLIHTNNAGRSWSDYRPGSTGNRSISTLYAAGWKQIWAGGGPARWVYHSDNSGSIWTRRNVLEESCTLRSLQFTNTDSGFITACGLILFTENGGNNWSRMEMAGIPDGDFDIPDFVMLSDSIGFAIVNRSTPDSGSIVMIHRHNGIIRAEHNPESGHLYAIDFLDDQTGLAAGENGLLIQTTDGGLTWMSIDSGTDTALNDIHVLESGTAWIAGNGGTLLKLEYPVSKITPFMPVVEPLRIDTEREAIDLINRTLRYGEFAMEPDNPVQRTTFYRRMRHVMESISAFYKDVRMPEAIAERIRDLPELYRAEENNSGVELYNRIMESGEITDADSLQMAIAHFTNAVILQPDSSNAWLNLALAEQESGDLGAALIAAEQSFNKSIQKPAGLYDLLTRLYLLNDRRSDARNTAMDANTVYPDNPVFLEYLADLDIEATEQPDSASPAALDRLIQSNPDEPRYRYVRAVQTFEQARIHLERAVQIHSEIWNLEEERFGTTIGGRTGA